MSSPTAIILAAGKSTRLKSNKPKTLHEVCGRPMLDYVLQACYEAGCHKVIIVVGHGKEEVMAQFEHDKRIVWVEQTEQHGTGHAAQMCEAELKHHQGDVFILCGDGPLIRAQVLEVLYRAHHDEKAAATMGTAMLENPTGYGRVLRDHQDNFVQIMEEADATPEQRLIKEVFPSYYCIKSTELIHALSKLTNNNKKGEYYLTDIFAILKKEGKKVAAVQAVAPEDTLGVNTRQQLAEIDLIMQDRIQRQLRDSGVTIVNSFNTYIESGVTVGHESVIEPFTFIGRDSAIGSHCVIGPFARLPRNSVVPDKMIIIGNPATEAGVKL